MSVDEERVSRRIYRNTLKTKHCALGTTSLRERKFFQDTYTILPKVFAPLPSQAYRLE